MLKRPENELQFVIPRDPLPSVEVDLDCIPGHLCGYDELVTKIITPIAASFPEMRSTIYVYQGPSCSFIERTFSAFFGVAGGNNLLNVLFDGFRRARVANVRFSDCIDPSTSVREFHIEDGHVWYPYEAGIWCAETEEYHGIDEDFPWEPDDSRPGRDESANVTSRSSNPSRFRVARGDASVRTIRTKIEEVFGLPEGSVVLCGPDKCPLRGNATIAALRKRWE